MNLRRAFVFVCLLALLAVLSVAVLAQDEETFALTIMHTNDTHSYHEGFDGAGGVAIQASVVNAIRGEVANSLLLDAGDRFTGTLFHTTHLGQDQVQVMTLLGYDAMALGNHEFDNGDDVLAAFIEGVDFPVLAANVDVTGSEFLADLVQPSAVLEVGGQQIGVIGLVTADTANIASPGEGVTFSDDYAGAANAAAAALVEQGVNKIIVLTHTGFTVDQEFITSLENVDIVLGGHSHTLLSNAYTGDVGNTPASGEYPLEFAGADGNPIYYATAGQYNVYLGRLDVEFDADGLIVSAGGDIILLSSYITPDTAAADLIAELAAPVEELRNTPTGATTEIELIGDRVFCRVEECALGNIIADAMRAETGAQIAIMNGGGIRSNIDVGDITLGDVLTVHPFGNTTSTFSATGADIIAALENGVSSLQVVDGVVSREGLAGRFPQVSGIRYTYDASQEAGSRIVSVEVEGEDGTFSPIDEAATYTVVTNNFVRTGGDGYSVFNDNAVDSYDFGRTDYEVLADYLVSISPITAAELEGRITSVVPIAPVQ
ncbi:MAG: 5'-nucleotidase C-terminal domain-containing protein [bacterium]|nr:5'-nucleotidase C-terminal domain-containing protein [bacterium]